MVDTDPRLELADLLADLTAWVAWQELCGAEIFPAEAVVAAAPAPPPQARAQVQPQPRPAPAKRPASRTSSTPPPAQKPQQKLPQKPQPKRRSVGALPSAWASVINAPKADPTGAAALAQLQEQLGERRPCPLCRSRLQIGRGEPTAAVAIISGETLVPQGREMLAGMLKNVLKIQPREVFFIPVNRCPSHHGKREGEHHCASVLAAQLAAVQPQLLLAFGRDASRVLFSPQRVQIRRGHWASYPSARGPLPTLMTFHPNFLLQHPTNKGHAFRDLKAFRARMETLT